MKREEALFNYCLRLADHSLIHAQRLAEWTGHGPYLEEDLALTNISLDMLGRSSAILAYAGRIEGKGRTEDDLAYRRDEREFYNSLIVEQANGDYARTIVRLYLCTLYDFHLYNALSHSKDETLSGIAAKAVKEITYHLRHAAAWVERFGDGTKESNLKAQDALDELWRFTEDMFDVNEADRQLAKEGIAPDMSKVIAAWNKDSKDLLGKAGLKIPGSAFMQSGSRVGKHSENL